MVPRSNSLTNSHLDQACHDAIMTQLRSDVDALSCRRSSSDQKLAVAAEIADSIARGGDGAGLARQVRPWPCAGPKVPGRAAICALPATAGPRDSGQMAALPPGRGVLPGLAGAGGERRKADPPGRGRPGTGSVGHRPRQGILCRLHTRRQ